MGTASFLVAVVLVGAAATLLTCGLRVRSRVEFVLAVYVLASAEVVAVSLALSPTRSLGRGSLLVAFLLVLIIAVAVWLRAGRPRAPVEGAVSAIREGLSDRAVLVLAIAAVGVYAWVFLIGLIVPQSVPDTMLYHLPRAALWKQHHAVAFVSDVRDARVNVFPPNAEIQVADTMILTRGDRYVALAQFAALVAACAAVYGVGRRLGLGRSAAAFGGVSFATFTVVVLQAPTALNDLVIAALLAAAAYFGMGSSRREHALMALALALAVGTKGTIVFGLPALVLLLLAWHPWRRWLELAGFGVAGLAAGSTWFVVDLAHTSHMTGGVTVDLGTEPIADRLRLTFVDLLELSDFEAKELLAPAVWGIGVLGVAVVVATIFAVRRELSRCCVALVAGAIAFLVTPMLVTWVEVAGRVAGRGLAVAGFDRFARSTRLPVGFGESPMHSSFGVAFVVLLVAVGALVVADVARRRLPFVYLAALGAVPLTSLVTVVLLAYDPQRMRYIVFASALAASTFGVALRVRPLAWIAVCLTVVSLCILAGYFVPRPANLAVFSGNRTADRAQRWYIQAEGGAGDPVAFRFLAERVPADATVLLDVENNTYLFPAWDAGLRRTVVFAPPDRDIAAADWLVVGPGRPVSARRLAAAGWQRSLASPRGWRIYRR